MSVHVRAVIFFLFPFLLMLGFNAGIVTEVMVVMIITVMVVGIVNVVLVATER